ncbi:MAG: PQQ-binding-like beta-propeller repeat protein, partial [Acidimicrobiales bacterium]
AHLGGVGGQETTVSVCGGSGGFGGIAVMGTSAFVPCRSSLVALGIGAGSLSVTWKVSVSGACSPVLSGGLVWCSERDGTLLGLNPATGAISQQMSLGSATINDFPTLAAGSGRLFVPEGDQVVVVAGA